MKKWFGQLLIPIIAGLVLWWIKTCPAVNNVVDRPDKRNVSISQESDDTEKSKVKAEQDEKKFAADNKPVKLSDLVQIGKIKESYPQYSYFTVVITDDLTPIRNKVFIQAAKDNFVGAIIEKRTGKILTVIYPRRGESGPDDKAFILKDILITGASVFVPGN